MDMEKNKNNYTVPSTEIVMMELTVALNAKVSGNGTQIQTDTPIGGNAGGARSKQYDLQDVDLWSNNEEEE